MSWRGGACDALCPGFLASGQECAGHGTCTAAASCVCDPGWAGYDPGTTTEACNTQCPGIVSGVVGLQECSGHGACLPSATCDCHQDAVLGYWGGAACEACLPEWLGPFCTLKCPKDALGQNCSAHGLCLGKVWPPAANRWGAWEDRGVG